MTEEVRKKQRRGFAAMDPAKQREIASKGGKASHAKGTGHEWTPEEARIAGAKGGRASRGGRGRLRTEAPAAPAPAPAEAAAAPTPAASTAPTTGEAPKEASSESHPTPGA